MRSLSLLFVLAATVGSRAQYFSEGWTPGQAAVPTQAAVPKSAPGDSIWEDASGDEPVSVPQPPPVYQETEEWQEWEPPLADKAKKTPKEGAGLLASEMSVNFFNKLGINITEKLGKLDQYMLWDDRVPMLDDDNFREMVIEEFMDEEEEKERVWAIVVSASAGKQGGVPKFVDDAFDASFNATLIANDLPHVRWARIDYLAVTYLTTKWGLWRAPIIMFISDRGQTLRFLGPNEIRLRNEGLRDALLDESWKRKQPWKSSFSPGGSNEYILEFLAVWMAKIYSWTMIVPKWMMYIASGSVASFVLSFMHRGDRSAPPPVAKPAVGGAAPSEETAASATAVSTTPSKKSAKKRKGCSAK